MTKNYLADLINGRISEIGMSVFRLHSSYPHTDEAPTPGYNGQQIAEEINKAREAGVIEIMELKQVERDMAELLLERAEVRARGGTMEIPRVGW